MSAAGTLRLVLLFEDEVKTAARLLGQAEKLADTGATDAELAEAATAAYTATRVALHDLVNAPESAVVLMTHRDVVSQAKAVWQERYKGENSLGSEELRQKDLATLRGEEG